MNVGMQTPERDRFLEQAARALESISVSSSVADATPKEWNARMGAALRRCALDGHRTVALFGAGTHTKALGETLREPPVRIACIIDDGARDGQSLWGYPVFRVEVALGLPVDAVILSGNSVEALLWERAQPFRDRRVPVIRLYTPTPEPAMAAA